MQSYTHTDPRGRVAKRVFYPPCTYVLELLDNTPFFPTVPNAVNSSRYSYFHNNRIQFPYERLS